MSRPAPEAVEAVKTPLPTCRDARLDSSPLYDTGLPPLRPLQNPLPASNVPVVVPQPPVRSQKRIFLPPLPASRKRTRVDGAPPLHALFASTHPVTPARPQTPKHRNNPKPPEPACPHTLSHTHPHAHPHAHPHTHPHTYIHSHNQTRDHILSNDLSHDRALPTLQPCPHAPINPFSNALPTQFQPPHAHVASIPQPQFHHHQSYPSHTALQNIHTDVTTVAPPHTLVPHYQLDPCSPIDFNNVPTKLPTLATYEAVPNPVNHIDHTSQHPQLPEPRKQNPRPIEHPYTNRHAEQAWVSDSSSTHDGTTHSFAQASSATIVVDPPLSSHRLHPEKTRPPTKRERDLSQPRTPPAPWTKPIKSAKHSRALRTKTANRVPVGLHTRCEDDREGHLVYKLGEGLHPNADFPNGRYKILSDLGEGTFGKVVECWDRCEARRVAIKVVRSINKYRQAARLEIEVLLHLNLNDPEGLFHCVKLHSWFEYHSHVCMVFEKLGPSLYDELRRNRFRPFPLDQVRDYAFQLLESVNFVHNLTLIHTDLKPENILLAEPLSNKHTHATSNAIKMIDFGSATFETHHHSPLISTRHYRAPEVILGLGWTYPCDLWSIGCILVELYTGQALFQTHENLEHLAMMSCVLGPIPESMMRRAEGSGLKYFRVEGGQRALNWPGGASSKASIRSVRRVRRLDNIISAADGHNEFFDLVRRLLAFEPGTRCTSEEALRHPFFQDVRMGSTSIDTPIARAHARAHDLVHEHSHAHGLLHRKAIKDSGTVASSTGNTGAEISENNLKERRSKSTTKRRSTEQRRGLQYGEGENDDDKGCDVDDDDEIVENVNDDDGTDIGDLSATGRRRGDSGGGHSRAPVQAMPPSIGGDHVVGRVW